MHSQGIWFIQTQLKPEVLKAYKSTIFMEEASGPNDTDLRLSKGKKIINMSEVERDPLGISKNHQHRQKHLYTRKEIKPETEIHNLDQLGNPKFHNLIIQIFAKRGLLAFVILGHRF